MLKKIVVIFIVLCSLDFYDLVFIPAVLVKMADWLALGATLMLLVIYMAYSREKLLRMHFAFPILLILISVLLSMFGAQLFHNQNMMVTAYSQVVVYYYLFYFLLHFMKVPGKFLIKLILPLGILYMGLYITQYVLYPTQITTSKMFLDRGTLRIFISGISYMVVAYFIWLYFIFKKFRLRYAIYLLVGIAVLIMLGTRQVLATMMFLTILFILQSKIIKSKFLLFLVSVAIVIPVFLMFQEIFLGMVEVSRQQSQQIESNIRIRAAEFFLTDFFPNNWAYLTGNGASGSSHYGLQVTKYAEQYGYYQSDIGLIGEYSKFGILFVVGAIMILFRVIRSKLPEKLRFIKYNFLGAVITLVTAAGSFGTSASTLVLNIILLYMLDLYLNDQEAYADFPESVNPAAVSPQAASP